jgi:hypothetical protein
LRDDFDGAALRRLARVTKSANQGRRLLALAQIYDGGRRSEAAKLYKPALRQDTGTPKMCGTMLNWSA